MLFFNSIKDIDTILKEFDKKESKISMMIRVDRCEFSKFQSFKYINFAIIALYKEHLKEVKKYAT